MKEIKNAKSPGISPANGADQAPQVKDTAGAGHFAVACLGGSAGGLRPYMEVLREIPADAGIAVVVVNHSRRGTNKVPEVLAKSTSMPVTVIHSGLRIEPNHVYVIPPNQDLLLEDGAFMLAPLSKSKGWPTVTTVFLESLARNWKGCSIAAILSGLDSDGAAALRSVKAAGGITIAQKVETAEHPDMPRQALASGEVDYELAPPDIGRIITRIAGQTTPKGNAGGTALLNESIGGCGFAPLPDFPIAVVASSSRGDDAFGRFLENLPEDTNLAVILIQLPDATADRGPAEITAKSKLPIHEVNGETPIQGGNVFLLPPRKRFTLGNSVLRPMDDEEIEGDDDPVDRILLALVREHRVPGFAILLSGSSPAGIDGLNAVRAEGGLTFAQDPELAEVDVLPRSAIASGSVDFIASPEEIARQVADFARQTTSGRAEIGTETEKSRQIEQILAIVRHVTGIDFTYYKQTTIIRRMQRRMVLVGAEKMARYVELLERDRSESRLLADAFLVNVTSFFREPGAYAAMKDAVFSSWVDGRSPDEPIRIWVPGCATGEEAYSVAIAVTEFLEEQGFRAPIQIFATDLSESSIAKARAGVYLESSVAALSPRRLARYFVKRDRTYQVTRTLRDLCFFAIHDVTRDPPFSRLDLISCCNLLIYLGPALQKKTLSIFHYALKPQGFLVLSSSESVGPLSEAFESVDRHYKIFARLNKVTASAPSLIQERFSAQPGRPPRIPAEQAGPSVGVRSEADRLLLAEYAPPAILLDGSLRILQVRGDVDPFLQVPQGVPTPYLTAMVRPGLLGGLRSAIANARTSGAPVLIANLLLKEKDHSRLVHLRVFPVSARGKEDRHFLVVFEDAAEGSVSASVPLQKQGPNPDTRTIEHLEQKVDRLEQDLTSTRQYLQAVIEAQEVSAEELRSANEEAQANNEELDTAKEELQASNEELITVNQELRLRNVEQLSLNGDLRKLLESINVPLIMVSKDLKIRWFTPAMAALLNLRPTDQGRPITDLRTTLIPDFIEIIVSALAGTLQKSVEFQSKSGSWLSLRIVPYRGPENDIEAAVIKLIDIDELKDALNFAEAVVETVREPLIVLDGDLRVRTANEAFFRIYEVDEAAAVGRPFYEIGAGQWDIPELRTLLEQLLPNQSSVRDFEVRHRDAHLTGAKVMLLNAREMRQRDGQRLILVAVDDITELRRSAEDLRRTNDDLKQFIFAASHDLREPLRMIVAHTQLVAARHMDQLGSEAKVSVRYAVEGAQRLEGLISGLREFWELSERTDSPRTTVSSAEALGNSLLNLQTAIEQSGAKISTGDLPDVIAWEPTLIQMFQNLIGNALKYRSEDPPRIHISASRGDGEWVFAVSDNGIGIDPRYIHQIFGVFKRLHPADKYPGTGMGLAICQKIVDRYGGRIWVESAVGAGAIFKFSLPG